MVGPGGARHSEPEPRKQICEPANDFAMRCVIACDGFEALV